MKTCTKTFAEIPFAHRQPKHDGHCCLIHGHNWTIEVVFTAEQTDENGFLVDFGKLGTLKKYLSHFDHALVLRRDDPVAELLGGPKVVTLGVARVISVEDASCEGLAEHFFRTFDDMIRNELDERGARVVKVTVHEDSKNSATYETS